VILMLVMALTGFYFILWNKYFIFLSFCVLNTYQYIQQCTSKNKI
jgi:hypothetical protein